MKSEELIEYHLSGWIPGPEESEEQFRKRAHSTTETLPAPRLKELFDLNPQGIPLVFSNEGLTPWQGAMTRIFEDQGGVRCEVQLREEFRSKRSYLGLYSLEEVWSHEATHAARCAFNEPRWEEWFAYRSSASPLRRLLGPLVERPFEVWLFLISLLVSEVSWVVVDSIWAWMPLVGLLGVAGWRLTQRYRLFRRAKRKISLLLKGSEKAEAFLFRLRDAEIEGFARWDLQKISDYIEMQQCLRWRFLREVYLCGQSI